ncbi:hypothetical protein QQ045_001223 [Rhodiola kirilowii]
MLPDKVLTKLHSIINNFWWKNSGGRKTVLWISAEKLKKEKENGGLGFVNFKTLNKAFLMKQCWRFAESPNLLVSQLFKAKYYCNCHIFDASLGYRPSHSWRAIHGTIQFRKDRCSRESPSGNLVCQGNSSGVLDLKSAYKVSRNLISASESIQAEQSDNASLRRFWAQVWKLPIPRKIKIFIWRGYHVGLPTVSQLMRRNLAGEEAGLGSNSIARDMSGAIIAIRAKHISHCTSVFEGEGLALMEAMKLAATLGNHHVIFETGCKELFMSINYKTLTQALNDNWYKQITMALDHNSNWMLSFVRVRREDNAAADTIAKISLLNRWSWSELDSLPWISDLVQLL